MIRIFLMAMLLLGNSIAFTQQLNGIREFDKIDKDCYFRRCKTEDEAIRLHSLMLDFNGLDTTFTKYDRGNNPIAFSYYNSSDDKIISTFIINYEGYYDVWFMKVNNVDTHFTDVIDNTGAPVELIYIKP